MGLPPALLFREEVQKAALACLSLKEFFRHAVFQGGTALRLLYESPRFSEDLDFVLREKDSPARISSHNAALVAFLNKAFPFVEEVTASLQKETSFLERVTVRLHSARPERNIRVNLELARVPSYSNLPKVLAYPPLNPAVRVESLREILADKVTALLLRPYLKGRDVWDLHFLLADRKLTVDWKLVAQKLADYGHTPVKLSARTAAARDSLAQDGASALAREMPRLLPRATLEQYSDRFPEIAAEVAQTLQEPERNRRRDLEL